MKTLLLSITGIFIIFILTFSFPVSFGLGYGSIAKPVVTSTPLKVFKEGISVKDIVCKEGLQLIIKAEDGSPACVTPDTANILIERGWAENQNDFSIQNSKISLLNVTASPDPIIMGQPFVLSASVVNHGSTPITFYDACVFPLEVSFDKITTYPYSTIRCLAISKNVLGQNQATIVHSDKIQMEYNASLSGISNAIITFSYESNNKKHSVTISRQFSVKLPSLLKQTLSNQNGNNSTCDIPYPKSNTGMPVLYMPMNSIGKICVSYSNPNQPRNASIIAFEARHFMVPSNTVTISASPSMISHGNGTIIYTINSGNKAGFYGMSLFCGGVPFAIGYDNHSNIVRGDFPWSNGPFYCGADTGQLQISGLGGIGVKFIP